MQVSFSEEFSFDIKTQVEKNTKLGLRKADAICNCCWPNGNFQQATTTSVLHHPSSLRSQDLSPEPIWTTRTFQGTCNGGKFQSLLKLRGARGQWWNVQLKRDFAQRSRKTRNLPYKPQALGYSLPLSNISGLCLGLGPWSTFHHDTNTSHSKSTQPRIIWQVEGRAVPGSDGLFFNLISQFEFQQLSPFQKGLCCPAKLGRAFLALQDKQLPRPVFIFLDGICSPLCD